MDALALQPGRPSDGYIQSYISPMLNHNQPCLMISRSCRLYMSALSNRMHIYAYIVQRVLY